MNLPLVKAKDWYASQSFARKVIIAVIAYLLYRKAMKWMNSGSTVDKVGATSKPNGANAETWRI